MQKQLKNYTSIKIGEPCYHLFQHKNVLSSIKTHSSILACMKLNFFTLSPSRQLRYAKIASSVIDKLISFPVPNLHTLKSEPIYYFFNFSKMQNLILIWKTSKFLLGRKKGDVRLLVHLMAIFYTKCFVSFVKAI